MVVLKSTRSVVQCPLHQHNLHYLSKGLIGSDECRKAVEQLELLVRRVVVEQRDVEHRRHNNRHLAKQQRNSTAHAETRERQALRRGWCRGAPFHSETAKMDSMASMMAAGAATAAGGGGAAAAGGGGGCCCCWWWCCHCWWRWWLLLLLLTAIPAV